MIGVVPARGGSKGLRHKNLLTVDGVPLVINAADMLREYCEKVYVCTEDAQIASVARLHGYEVLARPPELSADVIPVDQVMRWVWDRLPEPILMHQPTVYSPTTYLHTFMGEIHADLNHVMVTPLSHITWPSANSSAPRIQRQDSKDYPAREIGVRYYGRRTGGWNPIPVQGPIFDIDTPYDLDAARRASMRKGRVGMGYIEGPEVGQGHRRRIEAIADELQHLDVKAGPASQVFPTDIPAVKVSDQLDSSEHRILSLKQNGAAVITIEDLGPGIRHADVVINALYNKAHANYAVLRPEFRSLPPFEVKDDIENILVTFGGTDPSHYTEVLLDWFRVTADDVPAPEVRIVLPPGRQGPEYSGPRVSTISNANMAEEMARADLVITSAGRTIFEAGAVGVPVLCAAHNLRESRHAHLGPASGNIFMGLGLDPEVVGRNVQLLRDRRLREEMSEAGRKLTDGRGAERIARIVEGLL